MDEYQSIFDTGQNAPAEQPAQQQAQYQSIFDIPAQEASDTSIGSPVSDYASDIAKSAAVGVPKGIIGAAGLPGDIASIAAPTPEQAAAVTAPNLGFLPGRGIQQYLPTSQGIQSAIEKVTGPFYQPHTTPGRYAETGSEFLSNPLSYVGAAPLGQKIATAGTAALGSEAAGQEAQQFGQTAEAAARIAGGLLGGHLPNSVAARSARAALRNATSADELFDASSNLYDKAYNSGVQIKPQASRDLAYNIESELKQEGYSPKIQKPAFDAIDELRSTYNQLGNTGIKELDIVRKMLNKVGKNPDASTREAARFAISKIDDYLSTLPNRMNDLVTGHQVVPQVAQDMKEARNNYAAAMRSEMLEDAFNSAMNLAKDQAGSTGKGGNIENAMRQQIKSIIRSRVKSRGFSPEELNTMRGIVRGGNESNVLRGIGALAPTGIVSGTLAMELGHRLFGTLGQWGAWPIGLAAKHMSDVRTANKIHDVAAATRLRGTGAPIPKPYAPSHGYMFPLFNSVLGQSRGGKISHAMSAVKRVINHPK